MASISKTGYFPIFRLPLSLIDFVLCCVETIIRTHLLVVSLNTYVSRVLFRKSFPVSVSSSVFPSFSSTRLKHWELNWDCWPPCSWVWKVRDEDILIFFYVWSSKWIRAICWRHCLSSNVYYWPLCKNTVSLEV